MAAESGQDVAAVLAEGRFARSIRCRPRRADIAEDRRRYDEIRVGPGSLFRFDDVKAWCKLGVRGRTASSATAQGRMIFFRPTPWRMSSDCELSRSG